MRIRLSVSAFGRLSPARSNAPVPGRCRSASRPVTFSASGTL